MSCGLLPASSMSAGTTSSSSTATSANAAKWSGKAVWYDASLSSCRVHTRISQRLLKNTVMEWFCSHLKGVFGE